MTGLAFRLMAAFVFGRAARIDCFRTVADLLEAEFPLERALDTAARAFRDQGRTARARVLRRWRRALTEDRFAEAIARWLPPSEAMIFHAYGRVDARLLFAAAARVAELRERQVSALRKAVAMPLVLAAGLAVLLWAAGGHFIPVIETVSPPGQWGTGARLFRAASVWLYANPLAFVAILAAAAAVVSAATVAWTGPGRTTLDRIPPFSFYLTLTGSAFLFVVL